ncbi:hypothetical protein GRJ2_000266400 [Grus japonensis]|uniref:Uncharacterized protein n=1 Tax=Grus japonensis TaxID=30415 RepID=A0ABC9VYQ6_GRUJA
MDIHATADTRAIDESETTESKVGIRASPLSKVAGSVAQLKCIYSDARSMGNKQEKLEAIVQEENYGTVAIRETWRDDSHNWAAAVDGYKLLRRDRQGRRGGGVSLYVRECLDCLELNDGDDRVECLQARIRGKANKADIMVGLCYRPPNQDEEANVKFYKQRGQVSQLLALVLIGDFNLPEVCWKYSRKDVVRLCREKIRRAKAWLELNLASAIEDKKNIFINTLATEGGLKRISILFLEVEGNSEKA